MKDWLDGLREEIYKDNSDPVPKGFRSSKEAGEKMGITGDAAKRLLDRAVKAGKIQVVRLRRPTSRGVCLTSYYGPK